MTSVSGKDELREINSKVLLVSVKFHRGGINLLGEVRVWKSFKWVFGGINVK